MSTAEELVHASFTGRLDLKTDSTGAREVSFMSLLELFDARVINWSVRRQRDVTMDIATELKDYQDALREMGTDPAPLAAQAEALVNLSDSEFAPRLKAFNAAADNHSYYAPAPDYDYGALLLEALADACADAQRKQQLYRGAIGRAAIFASWATSGGEGLARSMDADRIARKLKSLSTVGDETWAKQRE